MLRGLHVSCCVEICARRLHRNKISVSILKLIGSTQKDNWFTRVFSAAADLMCICECLCNLVSAKIITKTFC